MSEWNLTETKRRSCDHMRRFYPHVRLCRVTWTSCCFTQRSQPTQQGNDQKTAADDRKHHPQGRVSGCSDFHVKSSHKVHKRCLVMRNRVKYVAGVSSVCQQIICESARLHTLRIHFCGFLTTLCCWLKSVQTSDWSQWSSGPKMLNMWRSATQRPTLKGIFKAGKFTRLLRIRSLYCPLDTSFPPLTANKEENK